MVERVKRWGDHDCSMIPVCRRLGNAQQAKSGPLPKGLDLCLVWKPDPKPLFLSPSWERAHVLGCQSSTGKKQKPVFLSRQPNPERNDLQNNPVSR